jgi:glycosyltransferase involved in cell wall biosynthesis
LAAQLPTATDEMGFGSSKYSSQTKKMRTVTVVIPTFNRAGVVCGAVESVLGQLSTDFQCEVIVIDDGSTDETALVLSGYLPRIKYIRTENRGVSAARNLGILESSSDWIAFLDSDDLWHPSKLAEQFKCIDMTGKKLCFCVSQSESGELLDDLLSVDDALQRLGTRSYPSGDTRLIIAERHPFIQSMLVHKSLLFEAGCFDESLCVAEDTKLIYRLLLSNAYCVVSGSLVTITRARQQSGLSDSVQPNAALKRYVSYMQVQAEVFWRLVPIDPAAAHIARQRLLYFVSRAAEISSVLGDRARAFRYASQGLSPHTDWRSFLRNLALLIAYPLVQPIFSSKWRALSQSNFKS